MVLSDTQRQSRTLAAITHAVAAGRRKVTPRGVVSDRQIRRHKTAVKMPIESLAGSDITAQIARALGETVLGDLDGKMETANFMQIAEALSCNNWTLKAKVMCWLPNS